MWPNVDGTAQSGKQRVDLELVLAVDISMSMDLDEQRLQRQGYVAALRDPDLHSAVATGTFRRIAVTYFEWAGRSTQKLIVPWTLIDSAESALRVADLLEATPISRDRYTSISAALQFAREQFSISPYLPSRRVVDVSGDGPNNNGGPVLEARAVLLREDVVINGLPISIKRPNSTFDLEDLEGYYRECVIGGHGAFVLSIREPQDFFTATRNKLLREIAFHTAPATIMRVQTAVPPTEYNCMIGEQQWQRYMGDRWQN